MISKKASIRQGGGGAGQLIDYITDDQENDLRVGEMSITNCEGQTPREVVQEMYATQREHLINKPKSERPRELMYHLIISFAPGEEPPDAVLREAERRLVEAIGLGEHQRISVVHRDTDCLHIHVAINKVHPVSGCVVTPWQDQPKRAKVCAELEAQFNLQKTNHRPNKSRADAAMNSIHALSGSESLIAYARRTVGGGLASAESWAEVHDVCAEHGLTLKARGAGYVLVAEDGTTIKASSVARELSGKALEKRLGEFEAANAELEAFLETQAGYERRPLGAAEKTALFAQYRETQRENKATKQNSLLAVRAEQAKELERIRAQFNARRAWIQRAGNGLATRYLYKHYAEKRQKAIERLRRESAARRQAIAQRHPAHTWADWLQREAEAGNPQALAALRMRKAAQREPLAVKPAHIPPRTPLPPIGQHPALRQRVRAPLLSKAPLLRVSPPVKQLLAIAGIGKRSSTAHASSSRGTITTKSGTVLLKTAGGVVFDTGRDLRLPEAATPTAVAETLRIARARYGDHLTIRGTDAFKAEVLRQAVAQRLPITFTDPALEAARLQAMKPGEMNHERSRTDDGSRAEHVRAGRGGPAAPGRQRLAERAAASRSAGHDQSHARDAAAGPAAARQDGVRGLPEQRVVRDGTRGDVLLPRDADARVDHRGAANLDRLRRHLSRAGAVNDAPNLGLATFIVDNRNQGRTTRGLAPNYALLAGDGPGAAVFQGAFPNPKGGGYAVFEHGEGQFAVLPLTRAQAEALRDSIPKGEAVDTRDVVAMLLKAGLSADQTPINASATNARGGRKM